MKPKIKNASDIVSVNRTDKTGKCFMTSEGHYFQQNNNSVLHVTDNCVNILDNDHIENERVNWDSKFFEITPREFENKLTFELSKFFAL